MSVPFECHSHCARYNEWQSKIIQHDTIRCDLAIIIRVHTTVYLILNAHHSVPDSEYTPQYTWTRVCITSLSWQPSSEYIPDLKYASQCT